MRQVNIATENGNNIMAQLYEAKQNAVLIIASATGVKQGFYQKFAAFVETNGITVITFDYAGIGLSIQHSVKRTKTSALDWGKNDLDAVLRYAIQHYPNAKINLLGHSIGGQLIGVAKTSTQAHKIILVAAQSGYWKLWKGKHRRNMWLNWHFLFPILIPVFGYMPSKRFSGMEDLPKGMALQWSGWGRKPNYLFDEVAEQDLYYSAITAKTTAISTDDDHYAPEEAVNWLLAKYKNADTKSILLHAKDFPTKSIGHFGIFRETFKNSLWQLLLDEIEK